MIRSFIILVAIVGSVVPHAHGLEILHKQGDLPGVELPLNLVAEVAKTRENMQPMRMVAFVDDHVVDLTQPEGLVNIYERPTYTFTIHAPISVLRYRFFYTPADGQVVASKWYEVRRKCVPYAPGLLATPVPTNASDLELLKHQHRRARQLDREIQLLNQASVVVEELQQYLAGGSK